jgi:pterin-4a-carbinolamine dehydratase
MPTAPTKLTSEEPAALGNTLPLWHMADGRDALHRAFRFRDFSAA